MLRKVRFTPVIKAEVLRWEESLHDWVPTGETVDAIDHNGFGLAGKYGFAVPERGWKIANVDCDPPD